MKKHLRKMISFVLVMLLLCSSLWCGAIAFAESGKAVNVPVITVHGESTLICPHEDGTAHTLYDDDEYVKKIAKAALPSAAKALVTGNWDEWCEKAFNALKPAYDNFKPDENGTPPPQSYPEFGWLNTHVFFSDNYEYTEAYDFYPDFRKPPFDAADDLAAYVRLVKDVTGQDKVILNGRCVGNSILLAYLYRYGAPNNYADIQSVIFALGSQMGNPGDQAMLTGTVDLTMEGVYRYYTTDSGNALASSLSGVLGGEVLGLMFDTLELAYQSKVISKITLDLVRDVYAKIKDKFIARIMREYYGRCGVYATMVNEKWEDYKAYVFNQPGDNVTFANLLAKLDDYHYNVQVHIPEILAEMQSAGVHVSAIVEYGHAASPMGGEECLQTSDHRVPVGRASFGATAANIGETLPDAYIAVRTAAGYGDYISADGQIDASTGLLPETTWYIKNIPHDYPQCIKDLTTAIMRHPGCTCDTLEGYPRFTCFVDADTHLAPLAAVNPTDMDFTPKSKNSFIAFLNIIKRIFMILKAAIVSLFNRG
ncbi:MAG: hypothetical protein IKN72_01710 [Clostridia bacterium]|nr:hypothetical protein [Clostridia bacterium]